MISATYTVRARCVKDDSATDLEAATESEMGVAVLRVGYQTVYPDGASRLLTVYFGTEEFEIQLPVEDAWSLANSLQKMAESTQSGAREIEIQAQRTGVCSDWLIVSLYNLP